MLPLRPKTKTPETMRNEKTQTQGTAPLPPAEWLRNVSANTIIYYVHNEVQGNSNKGNINVGTDPYIAEQIAQMAQEIALLREQVQTLCKIVPHAFQWQQGCENINH